MEKIKKIQLDGIVMKEILIAMRNLGSQVTRKEIRREIRDNSTVISENEVDQIKISKQSGHKYSPFGWKSNFAVKYLIKAGFIETTDNHILSLSEIGRTLDLDTFNVERDVQPLIVENHEITQEVDVEEDEQESWRTELLLSLSKMAPQKFELFCRGLLKNMGVQLDDKIGIQYVADGGLDGYGYITSDDFRTTRVGLQAKRWDNKVSAPEIDKFRGAMDKYRAEYGIFITTSGFTREAIRVARAGTRVITLIDGEKICDLVAKYQYYVKAVTVYQLDDFYKGLD